MGDVVDAPGPSARDCCVGTNDGQSYRNADGDCTITQCIGTILIDCNKLLSGVCIVFLVN